MLVPLLILLLAVGLVLALFGAIVVSRLPSKWPGGPGLSPQHRTALVQGLGLVAIVIVAATLGLVLPLLLG